MLVKLHVLDEVKDRKRPPNNLGGRVSDVWPLVGIQPPQPMPYTLIHCAFVEHVATCAKYPAVFARSEQGRSHVPDRYGSVSS